MRRSWILCCLASCGGDSDLTANERALASDGLRSVAAEAVLIETVERSFSGLIQYVPRDDAYQALHDAANAAMATAQLRLTPPGCLEATRSAFDPIAPTNPVIEYVLTGCSAGGHSIEGAVTSTWGLDEQVHIVHDLELMIDGAPAVGTMTIVFAAGQGPETRQRTYAVATGGVQLAGSWVAQIAGDGCGSKAGNGSIAIDDNRSFTRIDDLGFCAGEGLDVVTGTIDVARDGLDLRVHLLGGGEAEVFTRNRSLAFAIGVGDLLD